MMRFLRCVMLALLAAGCAFAQSFAFTVTPEPSRAKFHVSLRAAGLAGVFTDFEMPEWMPGFYRIMNYPARVSDFQARDGAGRSLGWERVTPHTWRVVSAHVPVVVLSYDVAPARPFVADNSMDASGAFIAPPGTFVYVPGLLSRPASVTFRLPAGWHQIASGLAPVAGDPDAFTASNFDLLFDSPILLGNEEMLHFEVGGRPHTIAIEDIPASISRTKITADLQRIVEAATDMMGTIPYRRYTFLLIGHGNGGIEHLTSAAITFNGNDLTTPAGYEGWLSYVAHEYFHTFNVKRIRPLALGPFDYESVNLTHMLWVSEGLTVYYQDLLLVRAGLITPDQYLTSLAKAITSFENEPGRPYESATESSWTTWSSVYGGRSNRNTTISYYDNGAMLGAILDLAIRHDSHNQKSLDDVMRNLYRTYYELDRRGFTDGEFRAACEAAAGQSLAQVFSYAATTAPMDYAKYFGYAGLEVVATPTGTSGSTLGLDIDADSAGGLVVSGAEPGSPAARAGLNRGDRIVAMDGTAATANSLSTYLAGHPPGATITLSLVRDGAPRRVQLSLAPRPRLEYRLRRMRNPDALQAEILRDWLREQRRSQI